MVIQITGTNTWNKGAELMHKAIIEHYANHKVEIVVGNEFGNFNDRAKYNNRINPKIKRIGRAKLGLSLLPKPFKSQLGIIDNEDVNAILDASGFAFGDQHPIKRSIDFSKFLLEQKRKGKKVILMPQALGPFQKEESKDTFQKIASSADLIFARDKISFEHAVNAVGEFASKIKIAPDFTNLVKPQLSYDSIKSNAVVVVPNDRMLEKASNEEEQKTYINQMAEIIVHFRKRGFSPKFLLHGIDDERLINILKSKLDFPIEIIKETNPVQIKKILGESRFVVASRFHGLVSALSQGVPCIGTSWSHKYEMLFMDYGVEKFLLNKQNINLEELIEMLISKELNIRTRLKKEGMLLQKQSLEMWAVVDNALGLEL